MPRPFARNALAPDLKPQGNMETSQDPRAESFREHWDEWRPRLKQHWVRLTERDLNRIDGDIDKLKGKLHRIYGYSPEEIEAQIEGFVPRA